jgi:hypothetical protein
MRVYIYGIVCEYTRYVLLAHSSVCIMLWVDLCSSQLMTVLVCKIRDSVG